MRCASKFSLAVGAAGLVLAAVLPSHAVTIHVPGDQPTIQAGIDAASSGDTVVVACGTYYEHDIIMKSGVYLTSETGLPDCVTIDAQQAGRVFYCEEVGDQTTFRGLTIANGLADGSDVDGCGGGICCINSQPSFTHLSFVGNEATGSAVDLGGGGLFLYDCSPTVTHCSFDGNIAGRGAGVHCVGSYRPVFTNCSFTDNAAPYTNGEGAGIFIYYTYVPVLTDCVFTGNYASNTGGGYSGVYHSSTIMTDCVFIGNSAAMSGGGARFYSSVPEVTGCAFINNSAPDGAAIHCDYGVNVPITRGTFSGNSSGGQGATLSCYRNSHPVIDQTIMSFSPDAEGQPVYCDGICTVTLTCCDVYGNAGGDWVGCIADQSGINGNISQDPLFCGDLNTDEPFAIDADSPCAPQNNPGCGLIGYWGVGCVGSTVSKKTGWGAIKALYR
jgi:hypothetical protein